MIAEVASVEDNRMNRQSGGRCECGELMKRLRKVDFAIYDTVLYLDVYPSCVKAQEHYRSLVDEREELCRAINATCGPLNINSVRPGKWDWTEGPWPWEPDAN